jgi:hypothetical protein
MSHTAEAEMLFLFGTVMDRDFTHDVRKKVAELLIETAVLCAYLSVKAAVDHFVGLGIAWEFAVFKTHSITVLTFLYDIFALHSFVHDHHLCRSAGESVFANKKSESQRLLFNSRLY